MNVLWISNYPLPSIIQALGMKAIYNEGWKCKLAEQLCADSGISSFCLAFATTDGKTYSGKIGNMAYESFSAVTDACGCTCEMAITEIIRRHQPDVIHIWGTEFPHTAAALRAARTCGIEKHTVISLQGIMRACTDCYDKYLPKKACRRMIGDRLLGRGVKVEKRGFGKRAEYEAKALALATHVIGRTDFDRAYALSINPALIYHFCGETMREDFYEGAWRYDACEKYTVFMSQAMYPIKGLHTVLPIIARIKEKYPSVQLRIAGGDILSAPRGRMKFLKRYAYPTYLRRMIKKYGLEENIVSLGPLDAAQMKEEYLRANVFLSGSVVENSPNSVCEALLLGVPTVASNVGGTSDVLAHKKEGYLYECDHAVMGAYYIDRIFSNREEAEAFGREAQKGAHARHNREGNYETLKRIYKVISSNEKEVSL